MDSTKGVLGFKRGHQGNDINTAHYEILLFFRSEDNEDGSIDVVETDNTDQATAKLKDASKPFKLMETNSNVKCSRQVKLINEFMGVHAQVIKFQQKMQAKQNNQDFTEYFYDQMSHQQNTSHYRNKILLNYLLKQRE